MVGAMYLKPNLDLLSFGNNVGAFNRKSSLSLLNHIQNSFASIKSNLVDNPELHCSDI